VKSNESKPGKKSISFFTSCKVPKLLPYSDLVEQLKKIDIGAVYEIDPDYLHVEGLETENQVNGAYRDLRQYFPMLADVIFLRIEEKLERLCRVNRHFSNCSWMPTQQN